MGVKRWVRPPFFRPQLNFYALKYFGIVVLFKKIIHFLTFIFLDKYTHKIRF